MKKLVYLLFLFSLFVVWCSDSIENGPITIDDCKNSVLRQLDAQSSLTAKFSDMEISETNNTFIRWTINARFGDITNWKAEDRNFICEKFTDDVLQYLEDENSKALLDEDNIVVLFEDDPALAMFYTMNLNQNF